MKDIKQHGEFKRVKIQGTGFFLSARNDISEIYIAKDTLFDKSKKTSFNDMPALLKSMKEDKKIKVSEFYKIISVLF